MASDGGVKMAGGPQEQGINSELVGYCRPPVEHRFKPGTSGNPRGRPRGRSLRSRLRELLGKKIHGFAAAELIAARLIQESLNGDIRAMRVLLDVTEGPVSRAPAHRAPDPRQRITVIERPACSISLST